MLFIGHLDESSQILNSKEALLKTVRIELEKLGVQLERVNLSRNIISIRNLLGFILSKRIKVISGLFQNFLKRAYYLKSVKPLVLSFPRALINLAQINRKIRDGIDLIIVWDINCIYGITLKKYYQNTNVFGMEGGMLPETVEIDFIGNNNNCLPSRCFSSFNQLNISKKEETVVQNFFKFCIENRLSKKIQKSETQVLDSDKNYIFLAGTDLMALGIYDERLFSKWSPFYNSEIEIVKSLLDFCEVNNYFLIYKPHPNSKEFINFKNERLVFSKDVNIFDAIEFSKLTITLASSLAITSLIYEKPVIMLGSSWLNGKGICYDFDGTNLNEILFESLKRGFHQDQKARWVLFASQYINYYGFCYSQNSKKFFNKRDEEALANFLDKASSEITNIEEKELSLYTYNM